MPEHSMEIQNAERTENLDLDLKLPNQYKWPNILQNATFYSVIQPLRTEMATYSVIQPPRTELKRFYGALVNHLQFIQRLTKSCTRCFSYNSDLQHGIGAKVPLCNTGLPFIQLFSRISDLIFI